MLFFESCDSRKLCVAFEGTVIVFLVNIILLLNLNDTRTILGTQRKLKLGV